MLNLHEETDFFENATFIRHSFCHTHGSNGRHFRRSSSRTLQSCRVSRLAKCREWLTSCCDHIRAHPLAIVAPARAPKLLELPKEREKNLRSLGAEVIVLEFNEALRRLTATEWMERLAKEYNARLLVTGYDNTFGSDGMSMNISDYSRIGKDYGIKVVEAPIVEGVSSSAIRRALGAGDVETAASMLGRPYSVSGNVGHGRELGRQLGFPTANLITDPDILLPAPGVYAAEATTTDGNQYRAVVNIGVSPTVSEGLPLSVEAYLINYSGNLYGTNLRLDFLRRLRDEKKFGDISALKAGIAADVRAASEINVD